jgi:hypothetical protein
MPFPGPVAVPDTTVVGHDRGQNRRNPQWETWQINFGKYDASQCLYDIKVIYADAIEGYMYKIDLCNTEVVAFTNEGSASR